MKTIDIYHRFRHKSGLYDNTTIGSIYDITLISSIEDLFIWIPDLEDYIPSIKFND